MREESEVHTLNSQNDFMNPPVTFSTEDSYNLALDTLRKLVFGGKQTDTIDGVCATIWSVCKPKHRLCYSESEVVEQLVNTLNVIILRKDMEHAYVFYLVFGMSIANGIICDTLNGKAEICTATKDGIKYGSVSKQNDSSL